MLIKNDNQRDWDTAAAVDRSKLAVGNSAKHRSLNSSREGEDASSEKKDKIGMCLINRNINI